MLDGKRELAFPESVVDLIGGTMGQPPGGFPPKVQERILRGEAAASTDGPARACRRPTSTHAAAKSRKHARSASRRSRT